MTRVYVAGNRMGKRMSTNYIVQQAIADSMVYHAHIDELEQIPEQTAIEVWERIAKGYSNGLHGWFYPSPLVTPKPKELYQAIFGHGLCIDDYMIIPLRYLKDIQTNTKGYLIV